MIREPLPTPPLKSNQVAYEEWIKHRDESMATSTLIMDTIKAFHRINLGVQGLHAYDLVRKLDRMLNHELPSKQAKHFKVLEELKLEGCYDMESFVNLFKYHCRRLEFYGAPTSKERSLPYLIHGLPQEYMDIIETSYIDMKGMSIPDIHAMLVDLEKRIFKKRKRCGKCGAKTHWARGCNTVM